MGERKGEEWWATNRSQWEKSTERSLSGSGWALDHSFEGYLLIGHDGERVSLLAHRELWGTDKPIFEIVDHEDMTTYWVQEVPTPQQAAKLLEEHGQLPETWDIP